MHANPQLSGCKQEALKTHGFLQLYICGSEPFEQPDASVMKLLPIWVVLATAWSSCTTFEEAETDTDIFNTQLLQLSHVLQRGPTRDFWDLQGILTDSPPGTFLARMKTLVHAVGLTYNSSRPHADSAGHKTEPIGMGTWDRLRELDRDPSPGGVFARVFVDRESKAGIVVFKGVCTDPHLEQCQIDQCYLIKIQNYGLLSAQVAKLSGFDPAGCAQRQPYLDYTAQANEFIRQVQTKLPDYSLLLTGHSLGGMLAIVTAAQQPKLLKALTFAPAPFHWVLTSELHFSEEQVSALRANDLVATCDPYDCGINAIYANQARAGAETCLYLHMQEPSPCQGLQEPYSSATWRKRNSSAANISIPDLLCKGSAHRWRRYEEIVLRTDSQGQPVNLPVCSTDFSVLETAFQRSG